MKQRSTLTNKSLPTYLPSQVKVKGKLGELEFFFKKILRHQQKILVVSVLSNRLCCREIWKNVQNKITKLF